MAEIIKLPELGEGIVEGTVISLSVKEGDEVKEGNTLVEIETDKAVLGVPATNSGTLVKWYVEEGKSLKIGDKICSLDVSNSAKEKSSSKKSVKSVNQSPPPSSDTSPNSPEKESSHQEVVTMEVNFDGLGDSESATIISLAVKEGDNVNEGDTLLELETDKAVVPFPAPASGTITKVWVKEGDEVRKDSKGFQFTVSGKSISTDSPPPADGIPTREVSEVSSEKRTDLSLVPTSDILQTDFSQTHAGPATRKLARELGVDLNRITGSGRNNRIRIEDVKTFAKSLITGNSVRMSTSRSSVKDIPDFSKWGSIRREKISKLRDTIAQTITNSWQNIPHVHQNDHIRIDDILEIQKKWKQRFEEKGSTLSVTPFIIKALAQSLRDFPQFNSSYDPDTKEIIYKEYFHVGVAVDTPQGLIVPVIKDVDQLTIFQIGVQLKTIAAQTRNRTVKPEDLRGGSITLSNLGGIGGTHFNPIINWPEVAILGVGRGSIQPYYFKNNGQDQGIFRPTMMLPICLAYDHRVIDGADGARFIVKLKNYLENPDLLLMGSE